MSMYDSNNIKVFDNEVLENKLKNQLITKLDAMQFATADYSLAEVAGMFKKIRTYKGLGDVQDLAMGEGNSADIGSTYDEKTYRVETTQGRFPYFDEQVMADPLAIDKGIKFLSEQMTNDMTSKIIAEFLKGSHVVNNFSPSYASIVNAKAILNVEEIEGMFMLVNDQDASNILITLEAELKYVEGFVRSDYLGTIAGIPIYSSSAVPHGYYILATKEAVTVFTKKGVEIEQERDANERKNQVFARNVKVVALTNDDRVVVCKASNCAQVSLYSANVGGKVLFTGHDNWDVKGKIVKGCDASLFGEEASQANVIQVRVDGNFGNCTVKQYNEVLGQFFSTDPNVHQDAEGKWYKEKAYTGLADYEFIMAPGKDVELTIGDRKLVFRAPFSIKANG